MPTPTRQTLPRKNRIAKRNDFLRIQSSGRKYRSEHLLLIVGEQDNASSRSSAQSSRIGITVTRKVDKRAVYRNKLRRRIKELFRKERAQIRRAVDLVVIAQNGACELEFQEVNEQFLFLLRKAKLTA